MRIQAKFRCNSVTDNGYSKSVNLTAIYGDKGENASFAKATPSGSLTMSIDRDTAGADLFVPQKDYFLFIEEVPPATAP